MKTFRLISFGILTVLIGYTFTACRDEDKVEKPMPPISDTSKKLVKIIEKEFEKKDNYTDEGIRTYTFKYDNIGNVIHTSENQSDYDITESANFNRTENTISYDINADYGCEKVTFNLSNDKICYAKRERYNDLIDKWALDWEFYFEYNSLGLLTKFNQSDIGSQYLTWNDYTLMDSESDSNYESDRTFKYGNKTCKGYNPIIVFYYNNVFTPIIATPELLGLRTNQLPISMEEDGDILTFTYEFYEDGYLKKCEAIWDDESEGSIYTFTWE